jgi:two-component system CheB/CheR fusion protein
LQRRRHTISDPAFTGFAKIVRDLTERKLREEANQLAFEREQVAREQESLSNQLKDNFIAVLSHELKHPLDLINVKAEMLPRLPEARRVVVIEAAAEAIRRSVGNQAQIIDDLLDLSPIRTGKLSLSLKPVDVAHLLSVIRDACEIDAQERGITLSVLGTDKPAFAEADSVRCDQILWNIVSNALNLPGAEEKSTLRSQRKTTCCVLMCQTPVRALTRRFCRMSSTCSGNSLVPVRVARVVSASGWHWSSS